MAKTVGYDSYEENVTNGEDISTPIEVDAKGANHAHVYVDDGSGSAVSESYDLTIEVQKTLPHDDNTDSLWVPIEAGISGSTDRFHPISSFTGGNNDRVFPPAVKARLTLSNSGSAAHDYRIIFEVVDNSR